LAAELADIYPAFPELVELLPRIAANDREVEYINAGALPGGAEPPSSRTWSRAVLRAL
jgi:hypothetical protein